MKACSGLKLFFLVVTVWLNTCCGQEHLMQNLPWYRVQSA